MNFLQEILFWFLFIALNGLNYLINYIFDFEKNHILPYLSSIKMTHKIGLVGDNNMDFFRYCVELSIILICSRFYNLSEYYTLIGTTYFVVLFFNVYQYSIRRIYDTEPVLFNDVKLLKNAIVIVWHESKWKVLLSALLLILLIVGFNKGFSLFLVYNNQIGSNLIFEVISAVWVLTVFYSIIKVKGFYKRYPNDIFLRYHFTFVEFTYNIKRSYENYKISRLNIGHRYFESRQKISIQPVANPPNIHLIFIESYGSYFYNEKSLKVEAYQILNHFTNNLATNGFQIVSNMSQSTTTGGQSWLTYSSVLFGYRIDNNTLFENHLKDENFRKSNGLMQVFSKMDYTNFHLNPINPIDGINVPYKSLRELYAVDRWILNSDINYTGDQYGFGACAPDQYSMNFTMELIKKECKSPYSFFYLTKNSHSPFIIPEMVDDWKTLNKNNGSTHVHKGFLKYPQVEDYGRAIKYQFDNLNRFINDHGKENDVFILMGDHQPPILSQPEIHGLTTPVHVISKNQKFLHEFERYGFVNDLSKANNFIRHESFYSIFLNAFSNQYALSSNNIPDYEPEGIKL